MRSCLHSKNFPSEIHDSHATCGRVQDAYSLRCAPQVHGVAHDVLKLARDVLTTELNSGTDNPMVFTEENGVGYTVSGGNFHGEYPSKILDFLAIAIHELASISERRIERLVNTTLSDLPAFLVSNGGLNSGFMIAHCTAAALVSENKGLCTPASIDTIPTSAQKEDHVSMGGWAARKALGVVKNVEVVLGIELMIACQAIDFLRPLATTKPLEELHKLVRQDIEHWDQDRYIKPDIDNATRIVKSGRVVEVVEEALSAYPELAFVEPAATPQRVTKILVKQETEIAPSWKQGLVMGVGIGIFFSFLVLATNNKK